MYIYEVETRNFVFHTFARDFTHFKWLFRRAWMRHCNEYVIPYDPAFVKSLIEDARKMKVSIGITYRDADEI